MSIISKGGTFSTGTTLNPNVSTGSASYALSKVEGISFDLKDIDFLLRKFSELNFNAKEIMVAYSVLAKLQAINTKLLQAEVEVNS